MEGLVMRSTGSWYDVLTSDGEKIACRTRGKLRLEGFKETNPVAVGDKVKIEMDGPNGIITEILPRENHILRQSVKKTGHSHVLAANVHQALLVATLSMPRTSLGFIDRFLVTAESFGIPQVIVFNKSDLLNDKDFDKVQQLNNIYEPIGVKCLQISAVHNQNLSQLREALSGKITLIAGHSGVGKSTIINRLAPHINQKVGDVSDFTEKGTHTTTFAEMFLLDESSFIIDTPGIKEWGLIDMTKEEVSDYFPEMRDRRSECKFGARCIHFQEPKCAVVDAVTNGEIALSRYENYLSMMLGEDNRK